jgi:hypothetical protein
MVTSFNGVKVFTGATELQRKRLGDSVTEWLAVHSDIRIVDVCVMQTSDREYHCVTITIFYMTAGGTM